MSSKHFRLLTTDILYIPIIFFTFKPPYLRHVISAVDPAPHPTLFKYIFSNFLTYSPAADHLRRWSLFILHFFQMPFFIHFLTLLLFPIYSPPSVPSYFLQPYSFLPHLTFYIPLNFLTCLPNNNSLSPLPFHSSYTFSNAFFLLLFHIHFLSSL